MQNRTLIEIIVASGFLATIITFFLNSFDKDEYIGRRKLILAIENILNSPSGITSFKKWTIFENYFLVRIDYYFYFFIYAKADRILKLLLSFSLVNFCIGFYLFDKDIYYKFPLVVMSSIAVALTICCIWFYYVERALSPYGGRVFARYQNALNDLICNREIPANTRQEISSIASKYRNLV